MYGIENLNRLCQQLVIKPLTESIECETITNRLHAIGIDYAQVFLLGLPKGHFLYGCKFISSAHVQHIAEQTH